MKVIQINEVCSLGSTGSICQEISDFSNSSGISNIVFYGQKNSKYEFSCKFGQRWENLFHSLIFTRILGLHGFGSIFNTFGLIKKLKKHNPDVIHLHNLHTNFINYPILYHYIAKANIPVVMTLHDCYNFTGQCEHYVGVNCDKFQSGCGQCPFIHKTIAASLFFDWSKWLLAKKRRWYERIERMTVVAVSKWLQNEASKSVLAIEGHDITCVYNWINTNVFYPRPINELQLIRSKYSLNSEKKYIIAVAAVWKHDTTKYEDILKLNDLLPSNYQIIVVGGNGPNTVFPNDIVRINYTENADELACLYSIADAYVHVSVCDTFGKVIVEAMACGTTPIVYNSTACSEVTGGFGITVNPHDVFAIVSSLNILPQNSDAMIDFVRKNYDKECNIAKYLDIYKKLLKK